MIQDDKLHHFRAQFHRRQDLTHLNNAGQAPMCHPAREAIEAWAQRLFEEGAHSYPPLSIAVDEARAAIAQFLNCQKSELAFFQSTAGAISQVALGLDFKAGDEIIVWDQEYPSNLYPWNEAARRKDLKLVVAPSAPDSSLPLETLKKLITPRTRAIASSWVQYRSGAILDLQRLVELTRPLGIFTCIDVIQGVGYMPFDFKAVGIDAACGGSHKWMTSAHGAGYLCLRKEQMSRVTPLMVGAMTFADSDNAIDLKAQPKSDGARFEPGGKAFLEILALAAAARLIGDTGLARMAQEVEWLSRTLAHGLRERGYSVHSPHGIHHRGSIVNFSPGPDAKFKTVPEVEKCLKENRVSFALRPPGVRLSPHAFNTADDIEKVLQILS